MIILTGTFRSMLLDVQTRARGFGIVTLYIDILAIYPIELAVLDQDPATTLAYAPPLIILVNNYNQIYHLWQTYEATLQHNR